MNPYPSTGYVVYGAFLLSEPEIVRYVGKTVNLRQRVYAHLSASKKASLPSSRWIAKHPGEIGFRIIEECANAAELDQREIFWISHYRALGQADLNIREGGDGLSPGEGVGEKNVKAVLTWEQVRQIRELRCHVYVSNEELALRFGVGVLAIQRVVSNVTWFDPNYDPSLAKPAPHNIRWQEKTVADEIRNLRQQKWIPKKHLARRYGISQTTVGRILDNIYHPDPSFQISTLVPPPSRAGVPRGLSLSYEHYFPN